MRAATLALPERHRPRSRRQDVRASTPRPWRRCWPSCRASPEPTRRRCGERRRRPADGRRDRSLDPELPALTLDDLGVLGDVTVEHGTVVVSLMPTYTGCPAMDVMHDDIVATLREAGYDDVEVRVQLTPAWSSDRISATGRRKLAAAGIAPPGPAPAPRWADSDHVATHGATAALPALRLCRHRRDLALRRDGVQVVASLPRRAASRSSTSRRCDEQRVPFTRRRRRCRVVWRRRRHHVRRPRRARRRRTRFRPGQWVTLRRFVDGVEQRRSYSICAPAGAPPRIGVREVPDGAVSTWLVRDVRPGDRIEVQAPSGTFTPDVDVAAHHVLIVAGSGITPALSIVASVLANPASRVTVLYGNRRTDTVMFADELADLKDRDPGRVELVHVLSREPRQPELFSGRLDAAKLGVLLPALVDVAAVDHWWLCGPVRLGRRCPAGPRRFRCSRRAHPPRAVLRRGHGPAAGRARRAAARTRRRAR